MSGVFSRPQPLAVWDPTARLWMKTPKEPTLFELSAPFSATWPTSGSMRNGTCSAHPTSAPLTSASAFSSSPGLLPTPTTSEWTGAGSPEGNRNDTLRARVRTLPTPRARDGKGKGFPDQLPNVVQLLKTPTAQLGVNGGSQHPDKRRAGGHGPTLADEVEHLMPTPTAADSRGTRNRRPDGTPYGQGYGMTLTDTTPLLPTPRASHHEEGEGAVEAWLARRAKLRKDGKQADTSLPLGLAVQCRADLSRYAIGASTPRPSNGGKRSRAAAPPGQLTIEDACRPSSSSG